MPHEFNSWSGSVRFTPRDYRRPGSEDELAELVGRAAQEGRGVRVAGHGHSSVPLVQTDDVLVSLERMSGLIDADPAAGTATLWAGTGLEDAGRLLREAGLAMEHLGDVDYQALGGVVATGTHGSGRRLQNIAGPLAAARMVTAAGEVVRWSDERDPELMRAARVSLGALGIQTALTLRVLPAYRLRKRVYAAHVEDMFEQIERLADENRSVDFYWYPRRDDVKLRLLNFPGEGTPELPWARLLEEQEGWSAELIPNDRELRFEEMEYAVPAEAGLSCFREVRERVRARHRRIVAWRVLFRFVKADDAYLSTAHGRDTVTISLLQNATLPFWPYFNDLEPVFRSYGGRPHWGKHHTARAADLRRVYPAWGQFQAIRRRLDPAGVFLNPYLRELLGEPERRSQ